MPAFSLSSQAGREGSEAIGTEGLEMARIDGSQELAFIAQEIGAEVTSYWHGCPGDPWRLDGDHDGVPWLSLGR